MPMSLRMSRCEKEPLKVLLPTGEEDLGGEVNKLAAN